MRNWRKLPLSAMTQTSLSRVSMRAATKDSTPGKRCFYTSRMCTTFSPGLAQTDAIQRSCTPMHEVSNRISSRLNVVVNNGPAAVSSPVVTTRVNLMRVVTPTTSFKCMPSRRKRTESPTCPWLLQKSR